MNIYPLLIEFVPGTGISRDPAFVEFVSTLPNRIEGWSGRLDSNQRPPVPNRMLYQAEPRPDKFFEPYLSAPFSESPMRGGNPAAPSSSYVLRNV